MARKLEVVITGDARQLDRTLKQASASTEKFHHSLKDLAKIGAAGLGLVGVTQAVESVVEAGLDAEKSTKRLDTSMKNAGLSADKYAKQIDAAEKSGRRLGFTNSETKNSLGSLITSTGDVTKSMRELTISQDLARFKGVSLETATRALTMANAGSMRAIKQLGISIIPVTNAVDALKQAHKGVKGAIDAHSLAAAKLIDKQATIARVLDVVNAKVHGQADAYSNTASGAMARFHAALNDIQEQIAAKLLPTMTKWINYLVDHLPQIERGLNQVKDAVTPVINAILTLVKDLSKVVGATSGWGPAITAVSVLYLAKLSGILTLLGRIRIATVQIGPAFSSLLGPIGLVAVAVYGLYKTLQALWAGSPSGKKGAGAIDLGMGLTFTPGTGLITFQDVIVSTKKAADMLGISVDNLKAKIKDLNSAAAAAHDPVKGGAVTTSGVYGPPSPFIGGGGGGGGKLPSRKAPSASNQEQQLLNFAKMLLGTPYVWGAMSRAGVDCSGLVAWAYQKMGINLPHSTYAQVGMGSFVTGGKGGMSSAQQRRLRPGDVIFTNYGEGGKSGPGHEALYVGGGRVEVARHRGTRVQYQSVSDLIGGGAYSVRRFFGDVYPGQGYDPSILDSGGSGRRGKRGSRRRHSTPAPPMFGSIGKRLSDDVTADATYVAVSADKMLKLILAHAAKVAAALRAHAAAVKAALAKARADESQAFQGLSSGVMSAFEAINSQWKSPAAQQLQAMQAEDAAKAAQQAYADAVSQYGADSPEAQAAARALVESQLQAQAQAEQDAHDKKVKADRDALEKQLAALEKEAGSAKTKAQAKKIQDKITALLKTYGITRDSVEAATDWATAQSLFVSSIGDLKKSMDNLVAAINGAAGKGAASGPPTSAGNTDRGTNAPSAPPSPGAGRGGHPPPEGEWWKHYQSGGPIPIIAHGGEYVLRADATRKIGVGALNYMNRTGDLPSFGAGGLLDPTDSSGHTLEMSSAVGSGIPYEIWRRNRAMAKYAKREARIFASRALYNPSMLPTPSSRADATIDGWMSALSTDALFTERLGALKSFVDSGDAYRGGAVSRSWLTYGVPKLKTGGYITRGGIAEVHRGETVTPAGRGMGEVHIYLDGKEITSVVESRLVARGRQGQAITARTP